MATGFSSYFRKCGNSKSTRIKTTFPNISDTILLPTLSLNLSLNNFSNFSQNGLLKITISPENFQGTPFTITQKIRINPKSAETFNLSPDNFKELIIEKPQSCGGLTVMDMRIYTGYI